MPSAHAVPQTAAAAEVQKRLARLSANAPAEMELGLGRIRRALSRLGDPQEALPPVIHVAGTNGKGSTIAVMRAILGAAGLRTHVYTSPHLVRFNERIVLAGQQIEDERLIRLLGACEAAAGDLPLTYFEAVTAAAFLAFAEEPGDVVLLETGLGGRLDATNVVTAPRACAITPIALDHQSWLGETLGEIAYEKAGILKEGAAFVTGPQRPEALSVLESRALAVGADPHIFGQEWTALSEAGRLVYTDERGLSDLSLPRLLGAHQIDNAALAVATLKAAGLAPEDDMISLGIEAAEWPARLQRLTRGPLVEAAERHAGEPAELWLDGGHNPHAAVAVARALADLEERSPKPLILIAGMQANKDAAGYFAPFADLASAVYTVSADTASAETPQALAAAAQGAGLPAEPAASVEAAIERALTETGRSGEGMPRILICGSLYLAGEVLGENG
ncbi:bifunctional folylpolyglutamate synthase/dihydrofolate synthase [Parvularcula oceani]|uniref:bifunctional folylpolyglutamate synthase/dihydrofolate synthase n=1 Tax=Parvularcula oceani TaxID=1247963 RepID=UPI0006899DBE|nr:folylpolyglutamate synthase/dihydrofolate synthase family protein [Parvularcula oceani]